MRNGASRIDTPALYLAIAAAAAQLLLLGSLHWLSPEFNPAWRVISEYANGNYGWVLSAMFAAGAASAWALAFAIRPQLETRSGKVGWWFLLVAGAGPALAALFNINHPLHNMAGFLGTIGMATAAVLISRSLAHNKSWIAAKKPLSWAAHAVWISLVLFFATTMLLAITYAQAGGKMPADGQALPIQATLPSGTIAINGWFNRLIILTGGLWVLMTAWHAMRQVRAKTK